MKKSLLFRLQFILVLFLLSGIVRAEAPGNPGAFPETPSAAIPAPSLADSIWLAGDSLTLQEVTVVSNFHSRKSSPLRLNTVDNETIARRATARTYPELIKFIPGVYATAETGSYGDARINIRGFKQENISVLLNGIPISGLTSGNMFWNNWMGLADATYAIQVQKGAGGSMLSDNSVGGTINIITSTTTAEPRIDGGAHVTDYGGYTSYGSVYMKAKRQCMLCPGRSRPGCRDSASCDRKPQARCLGGQLQQPARIRNEICQTCSSVFGMLHQRSGTGFQFLNVW